MEDWEKEIITKNLDKLIKTTICNDGLLAVLQASEILCPEDIEALYPITRTRKVRELYNIIQTRVGGFHCLLKGLSETNQTGALEILTSTPLKYDGSFRYDQNQKLGKGRFATVFKGELEDRIVAVKRLFCTDESERKRIENEIKILKICYGHPNIVRFCTTKTSVHFVLIVLELCDLTLARWVADRTKVPISRRTILKNVTNGLIWLHKRKVLYLNLKPANILLQIETLSVKLSGFGSSVQLKDGEESCELPLLEIPDTLGFDAPETKRNLPECTFASDVYSLGSLFCFVLTDGQSTVEDLKKLKNSEHIMDDTNGATNCVHDILTITSMTSDDPKLRPPSSQLLSFPILDIRKGEDDETHEINDVNYTNDPPLLRFIKQITIENDGKINGKPPGKSDQPNGGTQLEAEQKIEKIYQFLEELRQLDLTQFKQRGPLNELKYEDLRVFEPLTETVEAKLEMKANCQQDEKQSSDWIQKDFQKETEDNSENWESCNDFSEDESQEIESSVTNSASKVLPGLNDEQIAKVRQILDELLDLDVQKQNNKLVELVTSEESFIIKHVLNSVATQMNITDICDKKERSLLHVAVKYQGYDFVEYLINEQGFGNVLHKPIFQDTLIHDCMHDINTIDAEKFEQKRMILELLFTKHPPFIESKGKESKRTPLHIATDRKFLNGKQIDLIKMLLDANACVNAKCENDLTPLHLAVRPYVPDNVSDIIRILVALGADPDAEDVCKQTFLHYAALFAPTCAFQEIVIYLASIEMTKSFHTANINGETVLHYAVTNKEVDLFKETLELFKAHGVDFNALITNGDSVMLFAIKNSRSKSFLETLIRLGVDWKLQNVFLDTALHAAAGYYNLDALKLFIGLGCDINSKNKFGDTPLHIAIDRSTHYDGSMRANIYALVNELMINGADPCFKNMVGKTPIDIAKDRYKHYTTPNRILDLLVKRERNLN